MPTGNAGPAFASMPLTLVPMPVTPHVRQFPALAVPAENETVVPPREYSTITTHPEPIAA